MLGQLFRGLELSIIQVLCLGMGLISRRHCLLSQKSTLEAIMHKWSIITWGKSLRVGLANVNKTIKLRCYLLIIKGNIFTSQRIGKLVTNLASMMTITIHHQALFKSLIMMGYFLISNMSKMLPKVCFNYNIHIFRWLWFLGLTRWAKEDY